MSDELNPKLGDNVMEHISFWKDVLVQKVQLLGLTVEPEYVIHYVHEQFIYVIANPVVGNMPLYDDDGKHIGYSKIRNMQTEYMWRHTTMENLNGKFVDTMPMPVPRVVIYNRDFIVRLNMEGILV